MASLKRESAVHLFFNLTEEGSKFRIKWRYWIGGAIWLALSGFTMALTVFSAETQLHKLAVIMLSFLKYIPLLFIAYDFSRKMAAKYLDDVYELEDETIALNFLENLAFHKTRRQSSASQDSSQKIDYSPLHIRGEKIPDEEKSSQIILIGGPGYIQTDDSVVLFEKANGEPKIIKPLMDSTPTLLENFDRIREVGVGKDDEQEYAIFKPNASFTFKGGIKSRSKDGVPVEALEVKASFGIAAQPNDARLFDKAVRALVYNQIAVPPELLDSGKVALLWKTTIIPLLRSEVEKIIASHTLDELIASVEQNRKQISGSWGGLRIKPNPAIVFLTPELAKKVEALGLFIKSAEIGVFKIRNHEVEDELKNALKISCINEKNRERVLNSNANAKEEIKEIFNLIDDVVISRYEDDLGIQASDSKNTSITFPSSVSESFKDEIYKKFDKNIKSSSSYEFNSTDLADDMLQAFLKELLMAKYLAESESKQDDPRLVQTIKHIDVLLDI